MKNDAVKRPRHYLIFGNFESIEVIASALTREQWEGFCLGNILKYRIRAGKKDDLQQDIKKAEEYEDIFSRYQHLNKKEKQSLQTIAS